MDDKYIYIYIYIYIISHKYFELFSCFKRLCKTTKIFVTNKNAFFYLIFTDAHLAFIYNFNIRVHIHI